MGVWMWATWLVRNWMRCWCYVSYGELNGFGGLGGGEDWMRDCGS